MSQDNQNKKINPITWINQDIPKSSFYCIYNNYLRDTMIPSYKLNQNHYLFNKKVKLHQKVTNQKSSGRCWLFAALNMIRNKFINDYDLKDDFEFSQSYLFFWDKFERINYYIETFHETKNHHLDSRIIQFLLKEPLEDGGQWQMCTNLIKKYGLVPKSIFPESLHSSNSRDLNMILTKKLRTFAKQIRENEEISKKQMLDEIFLILVKFLGKPPIHFYWEYVDKKNNYKRINNLTPLKFLENHVKLDVNDYLSIIHDPRNEFNKNYSVQYLGNVIEGDDVKYINLKMDRIIQLVKSSIDHNEPVWFGCDVGKYLNSSKHIMDFDLMNLKEFLGINLLLNKKERIEYGESLMTHAMLITGYNIDQYGNIERWEIENSWGTKGPNSGYYTMSNEWMKEFVYQVVIKKKFINQEELTFSQDEISKVFPPWDPMGALAN